MEMAEPAARPADCGEHIILFNIHVERIEHDLNRRYIDLFYKLHAFITRIEKVPLEPVQDFQTIVNAAFLCDPPDRPNILHARLPVALLIDRL